MAEGASATFTLRADRPSSRDYTVPIRVSSTSMLDSEWTAPSEVTLAAGETSKTFTVDIVEDGNLTPFAEIRLDDTDRERRRYGLQWSTSSDTRVQLAVEHGSDAAVSVTAGHRW